MRTCTVNDRGKAVDRKTLFRILGIAGGVVVLALVIFAVAAISSPKGGVGDLPIIKSLVGGSQPPVTDPSGKQFPGTQASTTTVGAGGASGNLATTTATSGGGSGGSGGTGGGGGNGGNGTGGTPPDPKSISFAPISQQIPKSVTGYSMYRPYTTKTESIVTLDPTSSDRAQVARVQLTVHDRGTTAAAQRFIAGVSKSVYPKDAALFPVTGVTGVTGATGYFGTDGNLIATAVWTVDRYVYEVNVTSANNQPAGLKAIGQKLAETFRPTGK